MLDLYSWRQLLLGRHFQVQEEEDHLVLVGGQIDSAQWLVVGRGVECCLHLCVHVCTCVYNYTDMAYTEWKIHKLSHTWVHQEKIIITITTFILPLFTGEAMDDSKKLTVLFNHCCVGIA